VDEIFMPGEIEQAQETRRLAEGIDYRAADLEPLVAAARQRGVPLPAPLAGAFSS
jgi:LDH2 family malate/lactate/ureidoglycolate dehydrogenase